MNPTDSQEAQERKSIEALRKYRLKSDLARAIQAKKLQGIELKSQQEMIDALRDYRGASELEYLQEMTSEERSAIQEVMDFRRRQNEIIHDEEIEDVEELGKTWKDVLTESTKGALAGLSIGQLADTIMPREQLDAMSEVREAYIRTYGSQNDYKEIKKNLYTHLREVNKMLGVSAFSGSDIAEGMKQAVIAGISDPRVAEAFAMSAALLKKVGVDLGDQTAEALASGFGDTATDIMKDLANVMAGTTLFDDVKSGIIEATADMGVYIQQWSKTPEQLQKSASNYAAALGEINESFILNTDQAKALQDIMVKATTGDVEAMTQLATLGANVSAVTSNIKSGNWGSAFQSVLTGIANLPKNAEALKAMEIGFDDKDIRQIQNRKTEITQLSKATNDAYQKSITQVDGLTQAEIRAKEIASSSMADRIHNWLTLNPIVEKASEVLEKMNINASTASTVIGGTAGAAKGLFDTFLLMKVAKVPIPKSLLTLAPKLTKIGGVVTKLAKPFMMIGPWIVKAGAALLGFVSAAPVGTILAIAAAVAAVATTAVVLYKNWDKVSAWFGKKWDWMKTKVTSFKDTVGKVVGDLKSKFSVVTEPLTKALGKVKEAFSPIKTAMDDTFNKLKQKIQPAIDLFTAFKDKIVTVFQAVFSPIKTVIDKIKEIVSPIAKVGEVVTKIKGMLGFGNDKPPKTTNITATTATNTKTATQVTTKDGTKVKATEALNSMNARKTVDGIQDTNALLKNILIVLMEQNKTKLTVGDLVLE